MDKKVVKNLLANMESALIDKKIKVKLALEKAYTCPEFKVLDVKVRELKLKHIKCENESDKPALLAEIEKTEKLLLAVAEKFGIDIANLTIKYNCNVCKDTGFNSPTTFCNCVKNELNNINLQLIAKAGFDFDFNDNLILTTNVSQKDILNNLYHHMQNYATTFPHTKFLNYIFVGGVGTGKTCLACAVANALMAKGFSVKFLTAFNFNNTVLACHLDNLDNKAKILNDLIQPDLLVVDDLGSEAVLKNVTVEYLYNVLNERLLQKKHTIITTNLSLDALNKTYTERTISRISSTKNGCLLKLDGEDLRKVFK